jgi:hypothetical protein
LPEVKGMCKSVEGMGMSSSLASQSSASSQSSALKLFACSLLAATVLLLLFAAASALGTQGLHPATARAARHMDHRRHAGHRAHRKQVGRRARHRRRTAVHSVESRRADVASANVLLGDTAVESHTGSLLAGHAEAFRVQASATGLARTVYVYMSSANTAGTVVVGLYSDAGGHPGALLSTGSASASEPYTWSEVSVTQAELVSGGTYWLAVLGRGGTLRYRDRQHGPCPSEASTHVNLSAMPASWSVGTSSSDCPISAYVVPAAPTLPTSPLEPVSPVGPVPPISVEVPTGPSAPPVPPIEPVTPTTPTPTPPAPTPPTASFTYSPTSPVTGQPVLFNGSSSSCPDGPCTYEWSDDGGTTRPIPPLWPLGGGQTLSFTFSEAGTKYVRLVVTDASGQTATIEQNVVVAAAPPPLVLAPVNTAIPAVSGSAVEGETLSATAGSWTGSPTAYGYQWRRCNASGHGCSNISGATTSHYALATSDVGHTMSVMVTATNAGGSSSMGSPVTALVAAVPPPPPPSAPTNTVPPSISGAVVEEGETLSAGTGAWTGNPTSYSYQWQDCDVLGEGCSNVAGATASTYKLGAGDVGHTIRVIVTAANAGGATAASSAQTATVVADPPPPPPPPPSSPTNTVPPSITGTATEGQKLSADTGAWTGSPTSYTYQWQDCNASGESCSNIGGATASTYNLLAGDVGHTLRVVVTASNAGGSTPSTSAATATVAADPPPPPPPAAPTNTALPSVSGSVVEGDTLTASEGSWSGSPESYAYQWEDCNASGASCSSIAGATASTRVLASGDAGHTLRVVVKATNAGGTGEATSEPTATVTAKQKEATPENCYSSPEACGYPDAKGTGVENCASLPKSSGTKTITKAETIENTDITGYVVVDAGDVTLNHDCVVFNGGESEGSAAVVLESAASNFTISNTTVRAENTTSDSFEEAIRNNHSDDGAVASKDRLEDCAECIHQLWTLTESYVIANGRAAASGVHTEDWWFDNNTITANDDTLLNPSKQTAVIFAEGSGACENHEKVTNSLIAGGGFMFYFCTHASSIGKSTIEIKDNRFARRICTKAVVEDVQGRGGWECSGRPNEEENYFDAGEGTGAFYPRGGFFGVASESPETFPSHGGAGWEGNYWDDDLAAQADETK